MKLIADEHVSPKIVREVCEIALTQSDFSFVSIIGSSHYQGNTDEDWIDRFAQDGGHGILSADRNMLKRPTLIKKITDHGIIAAFLPSEWANSRRAFQASHILYWWPEIEKRFQTAEKGTSWLVPKGFGTGDLRQFVSRRKGGAENSG